MPRSSSRRRLTHPSERNPLPLLRVRGSSMAPALHDGDLVLARRATVPRPNDIVVVRWSSRLPLLSIKRATRPAERGWIVTGDNTLATTDSCQLGPAEIVAIVRWRIWPRPRRLR